MLLEAAHGQNFKVLVAEWADALSLAQVPPECHHARCVPA
jgi:hypothetical protein